MADKVIRQKTNKQKQREEEEYRIQKRRESIRFFLASLTLIVGIVMVFISLYMPPEGQIDPTVLAALGELLSFVAAIWGIAEYGNIQVKKIRHAASDDAAY